MFLVYVALIAFSSGLVKGTSGFGSSLVALPLLVFFYPLEEVVVMMITLNIILNTLLHFENKGFELKNLKDVWVIALFGGTFTLVGLYLLSNLNDSVVKYIAATLIFFAISNKIFNFKFKIKDNFINQAITGVFSGIGNGIASIDGPPLVFYLTAIKAEKIKFKNTLASYFLFIGIVSVIMLIAKGSYTSDILSNAAYIAIFAIIGLIAGMLLSKRLNEKIFEKVVIVILIFLGISMFL